MLLQSAQKIEAGLGIGVIFDSLIIGISRNPMIKDELFRMAILSFVLTEAIAFFVLIFVF